MIAGSIAWLNLSSFSLWRSLRCSETLLILIFVIRETLFHSLFRFRSWYPIFSCWIMLWWKIELVENSNNKLRGLCTYVRIQEVWIFLRHIAYRPLLAYDVLAAIRIPWDIISLEFFQPVFSLVYYLIMKNYYRKFFLLCFQLHRKKFHHVLIILANVIKVVNYKAIHEECLIVEIWVSTAFLTHCINSLKRNPLLETRMNKFQLMRFLLCKFLLPPIPIIFEWIKAS